MDKDIAEIIVARTILLGIKADLDSSAQVEIEICVDQIRDVMKKFDSLNAYLALSLVQAEETTSRG